MRRALATQMQREASASRRDTPCACMDSKRVVVSNPSRWMVVGRTHARHKPQQTRSHLSGGQKSPQNCFRRPRSKPLCMSSAKPVHQAMQRTTISSSPLRQRTHPHARTPPLVPGWGCPWQQSTTTPTTPATTAAVARRSTGCGSCGRHTAYPAWADAQVPCKPAPCVPPSQPWTQPCPRHLRTSGPRQAQAQAHQQSRHVTQIKWHQPHRVVRNPFLSLSVSQPTCKHPTTLPRDTQSCSRVQTGHTDTPHSLLPTHNHRY